MAVDRLAFILAYVALCDWAPWPGRVPLAVMLPVCLILAQSVGRPNPFSFSGARNDRFDPAPRMSYRTAIWHM